MTSKRYHKLCRAEMTKLMAHKEDAAPCIKAAATANPFVGGIFHSYQEAWDALRKFFLTRDNIPSER